MTYGDPTNPSTGRAQVPGSGPSGYEPEEEYRRPGGRASVPGISGSASVPGASGSASVPGSSGRASVPGASGSASVPSSPASGSPGPGFPGYGTGRPTGSASVRGSASVGSAAVGSASVGSASVPGAAGRASVGRAVVGGGGDGDGPDGPSGRPPVGSGGSKKPPNRKRRRARNIIIASIAVFIMLAGIGMIAGTYYFDSVSLPNNITLPQATTVYYDDGTTVMARIGNENRTVLTFGQIPTVVQQAVVATEDNTFYTNSGIDYKGMARAAWNNITGGNRQGASTISQQYARNWADLTGVTYGRKLREAVIAMKLNTKYDKNTILTMYLNIVYFGRGAYGIEAAAKAYFGVSAKDLKLNQAMALAILIKNPNGDDGKGSPFDFTHDPTDAKSRFDYTRGQLLKLHFVKTPQEAAAIQYPTDELKAGSGTSGLSGLTGPTGLIVHHVMQEIAQVKVNGQPAFGTGTDLINFVQNGGLKIVTTIDKKAEDEAIKYAGGAAGTLKTVNDALIKKKGKTNLQAALVSVEPYTGRVRAYYGGPSGTGADYASPYTDPILLPGKGEQCCAGHPPGSSFKSYTLATGLMNGYSVNSYWNGSSPQTFPGSGRVAPLRNSDNEQGHCAAGATHCQLFEAVSESLNTPLFALTIAVGKEKVLTTAMEAGVHTMWVTTSKGLTEEALTPATIPTVAGMIGNEVGFGQYPISVLDHATGVATIAANGYAATQHFVQSITKTDPVKGVQTLYSESGAIKLTRIVGWKDNVYDDEEWTLQKVVNTIYPSYVKIPGREMAGKTGTWQYKDTSDDAHAWFTGFTASDPDPSAVKAGQDKLGLATAVWVGNRGAEGPIKLASGGAIFGANVPGPIWKSFMVASLADMKVEKINFPGPQFAGTLMEGNGTSPVPSLPILPPTDSPTDPFGGGGAPTTPGTNGSTTPGQGGAGGGGPVGKKTRNP